jgi:hypothetical protein
MIYSFFKSLEKGLSKTTIIFVKSFIKSILEKVFALLFLKVFF